MKKHVDPEVFAYCSETCPDVDSAFTDSLGELQEFLAPATAKDVEAILDKLCAKVKEVGTIKLRDALRSAVADRLDAERERDELRDEIDSLKSDIDGLRAELKEAA